MGNSELSLHFTACQARIENKPLQDNQLQKGPREGLCLLGGKASLLLLLFVPLLITCC